MAKEGQGYPCCQHDMMMMMILTKIFVQTGDFLFGRVYFYNLTLVEGIMGFISFSRELINSLIGVLFRCCLPEPIDSDLYYIQFYYYFWCECYNMIQYSINNNFLAF